MPDAVVVGAGPNGLVAANLLVDAGWDVLVVEEQPEPGGAVRTAELTAPGFRNDVFSAFYPLGLGSPVIRDLRLEKYGLRWVHAPTVLAHPTADGPCAVLHRDVEVTARSLDAFAPGDGAAWEALLAEWRTVGGPLLAALFSPFPPVRGAARLARRLGARGALDFARQVILPVRRFGEERFRGAGGTLLLAGNALHTDLAPESAGSAVFGWLLSMLGQTVGYPVPEGGAGRLTAALVARLTAHGGRLACGVAARRVVVRGGRAVAVVLADGREVRAGRAVLADVDAPRLFLDLVGRDALPGGLLRDLHRFQWDNAAVKVDWALDAPVPWRQEEVRGAGTVHVAGDRGDLDELTAFTAQLAMSQIPATPYLVMGQMTTADPSRSPAGTESLWAYTHVPQRARGDAGGDLTGSWDERETEAFVARMEDRIEAHAPGFRRHIVGRHVLAPGGLQQRNANLHSGAMNGGTASLHQQLVFRPVRGLGRPETPIAGLYLASSSAHPGGGVHGGAGSNAARAALLAGRPLGRLAGAGWTAAARYLAGP